MLKEYGYLRVGAIVNKIHIADVSYNVDELIRLFDEAIEKGIEIVSTPEMSICGYTAQDLFLNDDLYNNCMKGLLRLKEYSSKKDLVFIVGSPVRVLNSLYNCAIVFYHGHILGITPKTYIPNYSEFYEGRYFRNASRLNINKINFLGEEVFISNMLCYKCDNFPMSFSIDICEDLWMANTPSNYTTLNGVNLVFNLSSSNETVGKYNYRKDLVKVQSGKTICAYVYASSGINESTSDLLFSGHAMISEPSGEIVENDRFNFESSIIYNDIDIFKINNDRFKERSYEEYNQNINYVNVHFELEKKNNELIKKYSKTPFLSHNEESLDEIIKIQSYALAKRVKFLNNSKMIIGISGGADSTLAFLISINVCDILNLSRKNVIAITMPGFGTSSRTYNNSKKLIELAGATFKEISIKEVVLKHFEDIEQPKDKYDITYENSQARERTQILFDIANKEGGIVVGTGDLSELALGWATYNGDHMSNYGVNSSIPKTLVTTLIRHIKDKSEGEIKEVLTDILNTPISPELLPIDKNGNIQNTEKSVGPYILHDFFLYHFMRYGASIKKIYFIAKNTFKDQYTDIEIKETLKIFIRRFFTQQFKRNCVPDGIKVGSVSLSPRGDLRLSSDNYFNEYMKELENL